MSETITEITEYHGGSAYTSESGYKITDQSSGSGSISAVTNATRRRHNH